MNTKLKLLEKAICVSVNAHLGQEDKAGKPYIFHPFRVMEHCTTIDQKIVAMLHDTIEDTEVTAESLHTDGFPRYIVDAVVCMTRDCDEDYTTYIERIATNPICQKVKIADITDNLDASRLPTLSDEDIERMHKYLRALGYLKSACKTMV